MKNKLPDMKTAFANATPEMLTQLAAKMVDKSRDEWNKPLTGSVSESGGDKRLAGELFNWATNDGKWYRRWAQPVIDNLKKHQAKGKYNSTQAVKLWQRAADAAADLYAKTYGDDSAKGADMFPVRIRKLVAGAMEAEYKQIVDAK